MTFTLVGWILFVLLGVVYVSHSRHIGRRVEKLSEYTEFLLQNRNVYEDHRGKYIAMLRQTLAQSPQMTLRDLAMHSKRALDDMASKLHQQACLTNALGRGTVEKWATMDSAAHAVREHLAERAKT